jgi:hypothetical protein
MMKKFFSNSWPFLTIFGLVFIFFWKFFFKGLLPIPGDIIVGMYFPWFDYKWGYSVGVPIKNPLISDVVSQIYIWKSLAIDSLFGLRFPLWDSSILSGTPLLASYQPGVFYPLNIFYLFLSKELAFSFLVILQIPLALFFTFFYLQEIKLSKQASLFGAVVFSFSAFAIVWSQWGTIFQAGLYLPLILFLIEKYLSQKKPFLLGLVSLFLAFSIFAGHSQITFFLVLFSFIYTLFRCLTIENKKRNLKAMWFLFLSFALGALISAVQLVPTIELFANSFRGKENYIQLVNFGLIPVQKLITFLAPDFFGNPTTLNYWGQWNYQETALYLGILPLFFIGLLFFRQKNKLTRFYLFAFLVVMLLVFNSPLSRLIYTLKVPFLSQSYASRGVYLLTFIASVLAALGFDLFLKEKLREKEWLILTAVVVFLVCSSFFLWKNPRFLLNVFNKTNTQNVSIGEENCEWESIYKEKYSGWDEYEAKADFRGKSGNCEGIIFASSKTATFSARNLILPTFLIFISWVLLSASHFLKGKKRHWLAIILILILFLDLFRFANKYLPFVKKEMVFPKNSVLEFLQQQKKPFRIEKETSDILPANMWAYYGLESASGYNPLYPLRYAEFIFILNSGQAMFNVSRYGLVTNFNSPLFDFLNNKYLLVLKRDEKGIPSEEGKISYLYKDSKFKLIYSDKSVAVLENTLSFPRAFLVEDKIIQKDKKKLAELLLSKEIDLRKTVILEEEPEKQIESSSQQNLGESLANLVEFTKYSHEEEILMVNTDSDKILVISETFYPGWKAFLDGKQAKIYRANYAFRAVFIPKGEHQLRLVYDPWSFRLGGWLSLLGIIVCAFLLLIRKKL